MQSEIVESVQHAVTPGSCEDMYYPGKENSELQCFPSVLNNRFYVALPSLNGGGTSTVIFNPDQGLSDIVLTLQLPSAVAGAPSSYLNWAINTGWGYQCIDTLAVRIGGSSLYYFSGDQLLNDILSDCEDDRKKQAVFALGGAPCLQQSDFAGTNLSAYVYVKMPWNSISALQKTLPLCTDLLTQPIQILVTFKPFSAWFFPLSNGATAALPSNRPDAFANASCNFKQTNLNDAGHLLARRENMNEKALTWPLRYFTQTVFRTTVAAVAGQDVQINLTGFRAGSLKYITLWACKASDFAGGNQYNWVPISNARLSVNGLVYYDSRSGSNQLWALCDRITPAAVDNTVLADGGAGLATATSVSSQWTVVPFSQVEQAQAFENELSLGLSIMNSVVNLVVQLPTTDSYVISASYHYAASLMFSRGTAEYVF